MTAAFSQSLADIADLGAWADIATIPASQYQLNPQEFVLLGSCKRQLAIARKRNRIKALYYEGRHTTRHMDIAIPPQLRKIEVSCGWAGTVVDLLEERINLEGFKTPGDDLGLDEIYDDNYLGVESSRVHLDALINGIGFATIGSGQTELGEPDIVITAESSSQATLVWDYRLRRALAGLSTTYNEQGRLIAQTFYLPDKTISYSLDPLATAALTITSVDPHNLGRVPMVRFINRDRASDVRGRSEITRPIRYWTDHAVRTAVGMEINREFYTTPQRFALNVNPEALGITEDMTPTEKARVGFSIMAGKMNIVPPSDNIGDAPPSVTQFTPTSPTPYIAEIEMCAAQISSESGIPTQYLGIADTLPPTADGIRQSEFRLTTRADRRVASYAMGWREAAYIAVLMRDGKVDPKAFQQVKCAWGSTSTPTPAANADRVQKLVAAEVLPAVSEVTWAEADIDPSQWPQLKLDVAKQQKQQAAAAIVAGAGGNAPDISNSAPIPGAPGAKAIAAGQQQQAGANAAAAQQKPPTT